MRSESAKSVHAGNVSPMAEATFNDVEAWRG